MWGILFPLFFFRGGGDEMTTGWMLDVVKVELAKQKISPQQLLEAHHAFIF